MAAPAKKNSTEKRIVIGNWKMNPATVGKAKELFVDIRKEATRRTRVETIVAPPFVYLAELRKLTTGKNTKLGAQDVFWEKDGTYTGEVSTSMLKSVGVSHVIIGHSERRALGEDDVAVANKVVAAVAVGMTAVLCIGESERDTHGRYLGVVESQLRAALQHVPKAGLKRLVVAYEPVWAISKGDGKGKTATTDDVYEMSIFIQKVLTGMYDRASAAKVPILYGGSVNAGNASALIHEGGIDGFLVGGASLRPKEFGTIIAAAHERRQ